MNGIKLTENQAYLKAVRLAIQSGKISPQNAIDASTMRHQKFSHLLGTKLPFPSHTLIAMQEVDCIDGEQKTLLLQGVIKVDECDIVARNFTPELYKKILTAYVSGHAPEKVFTFNDAVASEINPMETKPEEILPRLKFRLLDFTPHGGHFSPIGKKFLLDDGLGAHRVGAWIKIDNTIKDIAVEMMKDNKGFDKFI